MARRCSNAGTRACRPAGTGIPRLLPTSAAKQRSRTARAKNEYPSRSSLQTLHRLPADREQVADVGSDHLPGRRQGRRVEFGVHLQDRQRLQRGGPSDCSDKRDRGSLGAGQLQRLGEMSTVAQAEPDARPVTAPPHVESLRTPLLACSQGWGERHVGCAAAEVMLAVSSARFRRALLRALRAAGRVPVLPHTGPGTVLTVSASLEASWSSRRATRPPSTRRASAARSVPTWVA